VGEVANAFIRHALDDLKTYITGEEGARIIEEAL
jgi:hypothetical protein